MCSKCRAVFRICQLFLAVICSSVGTRRWSPKITLLVAVPEFHFLLILQIFLPVRNKTSAYIHASKRRWHPPSPRALSNLCLCSKGRVPSGKHWLELCFQREVKHQKSEIHLGSFIGELWVALIAEAVLQSNRNTVFKQLTAIQPFYLGVLRFSFI